MPSAIYPCSWACHGLEEQVPALPLAGSEDGSVRVWELRSRQPVRVIAAPDRAPVTCLLVLDRPLALAAGQGRRQGGAAASGAPEGTGGACSACRQVFGTWGARSCHASASTFPSSAHALEYIVCSIVYLMDAGLGLRLVTEVVRMLVYLKNEMRAGAAAKGPKRPQPLAPFCKFPGMAGAVQPWEGPPLLLDGTHRYRWRASCLLCSPLTSQ